MAQAGLTLPDHVAVITMDEPVGAEAPFPVTPVPAVAMPQLRVRSGATPAALLIGTLIVEEGCLRVREEEGASSYLVIWQPDYYLTDCDRVLEILDRGGGVVARVGERVRMGGGIPPAGVAELNPIDASLTSMRPRRAFGCLVSAVGRLLSLGFSSVHGWAALR